MTANVKESEHLMQAGGEEMIETPLPAATGDRTTPTTPGHDIEDTMEAATRMTSVAGTDIQESNTNNAHRGPPVVPAAPPLATTPTDRATGPRDDSTPSADTTRASLTTTLAKGTTCLCLSWCHSWDEYWDPPTTAPAYFR